MGCRAAYRRYCARFAPDMSASRTGSRDVVVLNSGDALHGLELDGRKHLEQASQIPEVRRVDGIATDRCSGHHQGIDDSCLDQPDGLAGEPRDVEIRRFDEQGAENSRTLLLA